MDRKFLLVALLCIVAAVVQGERCPSLVRMSNGGYKQVKYPGWPIEVCFVHFSCDPGYELIGPQDLYCISGSWSHSQPTCSASSCSTLEEPENGFLQYVGSSPHFMLGSIVEFRCDEGFEPVGRTTLACLPGGRWSDSAPMCQSVDCDIESETSAAKNYTMEETYSNIEDLGLAKWQNEDHLEINGFTWRIKIHKTPINGTDFLSFSVQCERWDREAWSFQVRNVLTLLPASSDVPAVVKTFTATFEERSRGLGFDQFIRFDNLVEHYATADGKISVKVDMFPQNIEYGIARKHEVETITQTFGGIRATELNVDRVSENVVIIGEFSFQIIIRRVADTSGEEYLLLAVRCYNPADNWSFNTGLSTQVISVRNGVDSAHIYADETIYTPSANIRGYLHFMKWSTLVDTDHGFINDDDEITVEALLYPHSFSEFSS